jgi:hypothetical protein
MSPLRRIDVIGTTGLALLGAAWYVIAASGTGLLVFLIFGIIALFLTNG